MIPLSPREITLYDIYKNAILKGHKIPSMREIANILGISKTAVHTYTTRIILKGHLVRVSSAELKLVDGGDANCRR